MMGKYSSQTLSYALLGGAVAWLFFGSLFWGMLFALLVGWYCHEEEKKKNRNDEE